MEGYLGEEVVEAKDTEEFKNYTPSDWSIYFIDRYGQIDGAHHKNWVLDQIARILNGCEIEIKKAKWENGHEEYRVSVGKESQKYKDWVQSWEDDGYNYDPGIAP